MGYLALKSSLWTFSWKLLLPPTPKCFETNMLAFIQNNVSNLCSIWVECVIHIWQFILNHPCVQGCCYSVSERVWAQYGRCLPRVLWAHLSILYLHNKFAQAEKSSCGKQDNDSLYGVEPQPRESRREWKCARRAMKCLADACLVFAQSTAERAAEDHVTTIRSDLHGVRLHTVCRARNWTQVS